MPGISVSFTLNKHSEPKQSTQNVTNVRKSDCVHCTAKPVLSPIVPNVFRVFTQSRITVPTNCQLGLSVWSVLFARRRILKTGRATSVTSKFASSATANSEI